MQEDKLYVIYTQEGSEFNPKLSILNNGYSREALNHRYRELVDAGFTNLKLGTYDSIKDGLSLQQKNEFLDISKRRTVADLIERKLNGKLDNPNVVVIAGEVTLLASELYCGVKNVRTFSGGDEVYFSLEDKSILRFLRQPSGGMSILTQPQAL